MHDIVIGLVINYIEFSYFHILVEKLFWPTTEKAIQKLNCSPWYSVSYGGWNTRHNYRGFLQFVYGGKREDGNFGYPPPQPCTEYVQYHKNGVIEIVSESTLANWNGNLLIDWKNIIKDTSLQENTLSGSIKKVENINIAQIGRRNIVGFDKKHELLEK